MTTWKYYQQVIPSGFYSIVFEHEVNGDPDRWLSTWGWGADGEVLSDADFEAICDSWAARIVVPIMSTNTGFVRATASVAGGVIKELDRTDAGTIAGPFGPVSNSVIIEKRTASPGRHNRGRCFLPCVPDAEIQENGRIDLDYRNACVAAMDLFIDDCVGLGGGTGTIVLLHSKGWGEGDDPRDPVPADPGNAPAPTIVTHTTARPIVGTQRSRVR